MSETPMTKDEVWEWCGKRIHDLKADWKAYSIEQEWLKAELREEVERLRAALVPFARYASAPASVPDSVYVLPTGAMFGPEDRPVTLGDCRRAAEALEGERP